MRIPRLFKFISTGLIFMAVAGVGTAAENKVLRMATTTSTENSGLLEALLPRFEQQSGYQVHVIAVGTGKALRMGRDGDVDVVLVHAPPAEKAFINGDYGVNRRQVMFNDFVIVGPAGDPAGIEGTNGVDEAMAKIARQQATFVSRGDDSGTHKKEKSLWRSANIDPKGEWYRAAGQGMGKVLQMSGELQAYTMTDRGTWLAMRDKLPLKILVEGDERLYNPYGIIAVHPGRHPHVNYQAAMELIGWMTSQQGQQLVARFRNNGEQLFHPMALRVAERED